MTYQIRKAAVIGSGTMGGGIAALLAGVGIPVVLLDIPAPDTEPGDPSAKRNAIVQKNFKSLQKSRPAQFFQDKDTDLITLGNTEDDLELLSDVDWVVEVIIEKLSIKQDLMAKIDKIRKPGSIISTNTSGLSVNAIAEGRSEDFRRHFLGTHFFNPPRYLKLLEIIPQKDTDPALVDFMMDFGTNRLGKGCVVCKDTPNFIANRFISIIGGFTVNYALENDYTVEEVDALTGPLIGHPKTATFKLQDLVGIDVMVYVARNLYDAIPDDDWREILNHDEANRVLDWLMDNKYLGRKTKQGFYKTVTENGEKVHKPLNLKTLEYESPEKVRFDSVGKHRKIEDAGERIKAMINEDDRAGQFIWHIHAALFAYASLKLGEIADTILDIDNANRWGFNHELGPFQIWDAVGVEETLPRLKEDGYEVAEWVQDMVSSGHPTFYQRDDKGIVTGYYDPQKRGYQPLERDPRVIIIDNLRAADKVVERMEGATLLDMGDNVLLLEFHSKANSIDSDIVTLANKALERLDKNEFAGMVIGNQGDNFSVGANIGMIAMIILSQDWDQLDNVIKTGQDLMQALRAAPAPVVTAPFGMALGGGAEFTMAGVRSVAHAETYIGLVEFGVGVIPAWTGTKELMRRVVNPVMEASPNADPLPHVQKVFEQIAMAKVAESAKQGRQMGFFTDADRIVMNRDHLLAEAKREVLHLAPNYQPRVPGKIYAAGRDVLAALHTGAWMLGQGEYATEYEVFMAKQLAEVLTGGVTVPGWVDEQVVLDLERSVFVELCKQPKTLERLNHMIQHRKPLRN